MITYICGSMIKYSEFPDAFWKDVDKLMADGDEILLGTSDFDHRVYGRCRNRLYKNVSVMRENPKKGEGGLKLKALCRLMSACSGSAIT